MGWLYSFFWDTWDLVSHHFYEVLGFILAFLAWGYVVRRKLKAFEDV